ncbi:MAG TPA: hypothetical protein VNR63_05580 [Gaiellaceae bacterium]|jgi:hypothetical protein|nr:hypothetical protein [Gaiellaceae bacterium]
MESVLVIGRIRRDRAARLDAALAAVDLGSRVFRQGETLALLIDPPQAERRFLRLLRDDRFVQLLACLEDVPLLPREVSAAA